MQCLDLIFLTAFMIFEDYPLICLEKRYYHIPFNVIRL
jgi:hypothetical protein